MIQFDTAGLLAAIKETTGQLKQALNEESLRAVGFAGAEIFREEAKRNALAHVQTGTLYRNIIVKRLEEESEGGLRQVYKITVRNKPSFYWRFVEYGHKFVPKNKKISEKTGKKIGWKAHRRAAELEYGTSTSPAYPFMRPAFESQKGSAVDAMTKKLQEQLERNASR